MGKVIIQEHTTKNPITLIGQEAGECWGSDTLDNKKNYKRGLDCLESGHMRAAEFPQVYIKLEGYSARVIRELYTHIGGSPTRLQASTRYIQYGDFDYIVPPSIEKTPAAKEQYMDLMENISKVYCNLQDLKVPKEDIANILPLGMTSTVVVRTNARQLIDMSHQRLCTRAYWEFRDMMKDIGEALSAYSDEWKKLVSNYFKPKCDLTGFCEEKYTCKRHPKKDSSCFFIKNMI